jgi:hypothetical protein
MEETVLESATSRQPGPRLAWRKRLVAVSVIWLLLCGLVWGLLCLQYLPAHRQIYLVKLRGSIRTLSASQFTNIRQTSLQFDLRRHPSSLENYRAGLEFVVSQQAEAQQSQQKHRSTAVHQPRDSELDAGTSLGTQYALELADPEPASSVTAADFDFRFGGDANASEESAWLALSDMPLGIALDTELVEAASNASDSAAQAGSGDRASLGSLPLPLYEEEAISQWLSRPEAGLGLQPLDRPSLSQRGGGVLPILDQLIHRPRRALRGLV